MKVKIKGVKSFLGRHIINLPGWRTKRKIVVIESDDWGSIRIPSKNILENLRSKGFNKTGNPFNMYDALETEDDLISLFDLLSRYQDIHGNPPIITANFVVANPNFEEIKRSKYEKYFFELIFNTYQRYNATSKSLSLIKEGMDSKYLKPQYHGREHVNVTRWLNLLQNNSSKYMLAFENGVFSVEDDAPSKKKNLMAAFNFEDVNQKLEISNIIKEGYSEFSRLFNFNSQSIIAPCNTWHPDHELVFNELGIKYIQGLFIQYVPQIGKNVLRKVTHYNGQKNKLNQVYLVRNCFFEPSTIKNYDWIGQCLKRCETAFFWRKPIVISMHRLNFVGSISEENRRSNHLKLDELLKRMLSKWPEIEFLTSDQLGYLMTKSNSECVG